MSVNTMTFEQMSTVLTSITQQATKQAVETPTDDYFCSPSLFRELYRSEF